MARGLVTIFGGRRPVAGKTDTQPWRLAAGLSAIAELCGAVFQERTRLYRSRPFHNRGDRTRFGQHRQFGQWGRDNESNGFVARGRDADLILAEGLRWACFDGVATPGISGNRCQAADIAEDDVAGRCFWLLDPSGQAQNGCSRGPPGPSAIFSGPRLCGLAGVVLNRVREPPRHEDLVRRAMNVRRHLRARRPLAPSMRPIAIAQKRASRACVQAGGARARPRTI